MMTENFLLFCYFATLICLISCKIEEEEDHVLVLTGKNFDQAIKKYQFILVQFHAPWNAYCKELAPEYSKAAKLLKQQSSQVRLAKVHAIQEQELSDQFQVSGYPTLIFFIDGYRVDYDGGRNSYEIAQWLDKKTSDSAITIESVGELKKFQENNELAVLALFNNLNNENVKTFSFISKTTEKASFAISTNPAVFTELKLKPEECSEQLVVFKEFDEKINFHKGEFTREAINRFIQAIQLPLISEFNPRTAQKIFGGAMKEAVVLLVSKTASNFQSIISQYKEAASKFKGKVIFVLLNADDIKLNSKVEILMELAGLNKQHQGPIVRLIDFNKSEQLARYKPDSDQITAASLTQFVQDYLDKNISPFKLVQEIPPGWDAKPVKILTVKNFDQVAKDKTKNVLVKFYAPWCTKSAEFAAAFSKLADEFKNMPEFIFAEMDSTQNELEDFEIKKYPTIKLFPQFSSEAIDYEGDRSVEDLKNFLKNNSKKITSVSVDKPDVEKQEL